MKRNILEGGMPLQMLPTWARQDDVEISLDPSPQPRQCAAEDVYPFSPVMIARRLA